MASPTADLATRPEPQAPSLTLAALGHLKESRRGQLTLSLPASTSGSPADVATPHCLPARGSPPAAHRSVHRRPSPVTRRQLPVTRTRSPGPGCRGPVNGSRFARWGAPDLLTVDRPRASLLPSFRPESDQGSSRQPLDPAYRSRVVQEFRTVAGAGVHGVPATLAVPSPARPDRRLWTVDGVPVTSAVDQAVAVPSLGLPGPGEICPGQHPGSPHPAWVQRHAWPASERFERGLSPVR
jgi:hypothetical protein